MSIVQMVENLNVVTIRKMTVPVVLHNETYDDAPNVSSIFQSAPSTVDNSIKNL